ncbi:ATP-dependent Clp protease proteolytic subunit [Pantoea sp.]|uniref:ATP-dependent Clp protease proteolytic subunit n=1 Tax=Pantoea sp. TaxID=69393 RepID=UPI0028977839|nr:ATP-dependent Clp protease proteolytic subunit [Pantoea sp.]
MQQQTGMDTFMKKIVSKLLILTSIAATPWAAANTNFVGKKVEENKEIKSAKIVYFGNISSNKISELMSSIDDINNNYPTVSEIKLYINSGGGEMEAGYAAAQAVKGSRIPVKTINASITGSSATLIYCAAEKRATLASATFYIHSASIGNSGMNYLQPNHINDLKKNVNNANEIFRDVYKDCLKKSSIDLDKVLFSEDNSLYLRYPESVKSGLANTLETSIAQTDIAYYIADNNDKD